MLNSDRLLSYLPKLEIKYVEFLDFFFSVYLECQQSQAQMSVRYERRSSPDFRPLSRDPNLQSYAEIGIHIRTICSRQERI